MQSDNHLSRWPSYSESHLCRWLSCLFQAWPPINVWSPSQLKAIWPSFSEVGQLSWSWQLKAEQVWPCCACSRNTWLSFPKQEDMGDLGAKDMTWYVILMQPAKHKTSKSLNSLSICLFAGSCSSSFSPHTRPFFWLFTTLAAEISLQGLHHCKADTLVMRCWDISSGLCFPPLRAAALESLPPSDSSAQHQ